jgi:hypothetical protein
MARTQRIRKVDRTTHLLRVGPGALEAAPPSREFIPPVFLGLEKSLGAIGTSALELRSFNAPVRISLRNH